MSQSATPSIDCVCPAPVPLTACFDGPQLTSDGGLVWLAEADAALGLTPRLAETIPEWRTGFIQHSRLELLRQRLYQIACGYEDQDDADTLRHDPLFKLACGRLPEEPPLASQPTLSRFENAIGGRTCRRLADALLALYLDERGRNGRPTRILIDADSTDDPTYGDQEGSAYHGYYQQHMYHPLLLWDGDTDQPIAAVLRPGTCHASRGILGILRRVVTAIRGRWPNVPIELRADSGFGVPRLYQFCEREHLAYTIAIGRNDRLAALAADRLAEAKEQYRTTGEKARLFGEISYAAGSWETERRVIYKAEWLRKGANTRFVVTTRDDAPQALYDWYCQRGGGPELWIKDLKQGCFADRLSDHTFHANQFRLLLHVAVY
ncbi:MAG: IS1380 family transposase [Chloroflexota bacterium]|nr:IS1380 family transposase [Chloroflexota bacterium]